MNLIRFLFISFLLIGAARAQSTYLSVTDSRYSGTSPSSYAYALEAHLKIGSSIGLPNSGIPYYTLLGLRGWGSDNSGGQAHELAFSNYGKIFFRSGNSPTWEVWRQIVTADSSGNIGIGTTSPASQFELNALSPIITLTPSNYSGAYRSTFGMGTGAETYLIFGNNGRNEIRAGKDVAGGYLDFFTNNTTGQTSASDGNLAMRLTASGNVGIGTTLPSEKLAVNGKILAKEIKVTTTAWPDYVFEDNYQTMSLTELEKFITTHKHLPEIPTAQDAETNGIALGEMNKLLLKKVEELTLLLIEQSKKTAALASEVAHLKTTIKP